VRVHQALAVARHDRLAAEHVALHAGRRGVVVHGQRAHDRRRVLLAVAHVRLLADEVLVLDLAPGHAGLDHVVLAVQLEAERAVALLEPAGGAVHADAGRHDPVRLAASATMSHSRAPCSIGTYSSQPRSPTYEIREASTRSGPISIVSQVANGKPSCETSALVSEPRMSRAAGPTARAWSSSR
jgi:hypothetical protein